MFRTISVSDRSAANEILEVTYDILEDIPLEHLEVPGLKTPNVIGLSGVCMELSDAVTRAAHSLGIVASRERHIGHCLTSFGPTDRPLQEDDPILCTTWGQFNPDAFLEDPGEFFGARQDIAALVDGSRRYYDNQYAAQSTLFRQVTHAPPVHITKYHPERYWLSTTPEGILGGDYPMGEVPYSQYPTFEWS